MDRLLIHELARITDSPVDRAKAENVHIRCPYYLDPRRHPPGDKGTPTLSVLVNTAGPSSCYCHRCQVAGTLSSVFAQAEADIGGLAAAVAFTAENDQPSFAAALSRARAIRTGAPAEVDRLTYGEWLERYALQCYRNGVPEYLVKRGIIRSDVVKWQIGYDPERGRATFPCRDHRGRLVGISRRAVSPEITPKYHDEPVGQWKRGVFYGENFIDPTREHVRLVEGCTSTVWAARVLPNVLGVLGATTGITPERLRKLRQWARTVTVIYENDEAGRRAVHGWKDPKGKWHPGLKQQLRPYFPVRIASLPGEKDPADVTAAELIRADREARYLAFDKRETPAYNPPPLPT